MCVSLRLGDAEPLQGVGNIARYAQRHGVLLAVQCCGDAHILRAFPVDGDGVQLLEQFDEMLRILVGLILDTKVVDHQCEGNVTLVVAEQGGGAGAWVVAPFAQVTNQPLACQDASLWEAIDPLVDACQHMPITGNGVEVIALLDGGGESGVTPSCTQPPPWVCPDKVISPRGNMFLGKV